METEKQKKIKAYLGLDRLTPYEKQYLDKKNMVIMRALTAFLCVIIIFALVYFNIIFKPDNEDFATLYYSPLWYYGHIISYISLFVISLYMLIISSVYLKKSKKMGHGFITTNIYIFLTVYNAFGIYSSVADYQIHGQIVGMIIIMAVSYLVFNLNPIGTVVSLTCYLLGFFYVVMNIPLVSPEVFPDLQMSVDTMLYTYAAILYFAAVVVSIFTYGTAITAARNQFKLEELNTQLAELSMTDDLTDLANRFALKTNMTKFYHNELNLMMIDIDDFKKLNDTYGHQIGDEVLKTFAGLLIDAFGKANVYRYGGDEFLIVSNETVIDFKKKLKHLRSKVGSYHYRGSELCFSSGYYHHFMANHEDFDHALEEADRRLYYSKNHGKNMDTSTLVSNP